MQHTHTSNRIKPIFSSGNRFSGFALVTILILSGQIAIHAQPARGGTVRGTVADAVTRTPLSLANVILYSLPDTARVAGVATDKQGRFALTGIAEGRFFVLVSSIGFTEYRSEPFTLDARNDEAALGHILLEEQVVELEEILVTSDKSLYNMSIDRKVFNVEQDLMSSAGSASELLMNVPSVQVDIDGTVSLRGSESVMIMINGKLSPMLRRSASTVLEQLPASSIERIEIITNPSSKYKPDGSAGIINIVLKKETGAGWNGDIIGGIGNNGRYNANLTFNYNPGGVNLFGSYGVRRQFRNRLNNDDRTYVDSAGNSTYFDGHTDAQSRPFSHLFTAGTDYPIDERHHAGITGEYIYESFSGSETANRTLRSQTYAVTEDYTRQRATDELEDEYNVSAYYEYNFPSEDHVLRAEFTTMGDVEQEDNRYSNIYRTPVQPPAYENTRISNEETVRRVTAEYTDPLSENAKLEAGYVGEFNNSDNDYFVEEYDPGTQQFTVDTLKTNHFILDESIHALYSTYRHSFGAFGFQAGLRAEQAYTAPQLVTLDSTVHTEYFSMYPSLHLSYKLNPEAELQLSYSRRVRRPDMDDLNPFPEYRDPTFQWTGNPYLEPEYTNSYEFGCQFEFDAVSVLPSAYYRGTRNQITYLTTSINDSILRLSRYNLDREQSGGLEIVLSASAGKLLTMHLNGNLFYNQIDATSLGFGEKKSTTSWSGNFTSNLNVAAGSRIQFNANYRSKRLTPQGEVRPRYVVNAGYRHELFDGRLALIFTVSDIFNSLKREYVTDTPALQRTVTDARDNRVFSLSFTYHFGSRSKKRNGDKMEFDESL